MTRTATALLAIAAAGGLVWWVLLLADPSLGAAFLPAGVPPEMIRTFVLADLVCFVLLPAAAAWGIARSRPWARAALLLYCGAALYAALWGWGTVLTTGEGLRGAALMTPPAVVFPVLAARLAGRRAA
jgi:hypothetical protein